jgi:hypothetical protein
MDVFGMGTPAVRGRIGREQTSRIGTENLKGIASVTKRTKNSFLCGDGGVWLYGNVE